MGYSQEKPEANKITPPEKIPKLTDIEYADGGKKLNIYDENGELMGYMDGTAAAAARKELEKANRLRHDSFRDSASVNGVKNYSPAKTSGTVENRSRRTKPPESALPTEDAQQMGKYVLSALLEEVKETREISRMPKDDNIFIKMLGQMGEIYELLEDQTGRIIEITKKDERDNVVAFFKMPDEYPDTGYSSMQKAQNEALKRGVGKQIN